MEMEYKDTSRRGKFIIVLGIVLAVAAGGAAFYLINQAQQLAGSGTAPKVTVIVAARAIAARKPIEDGDLLVRTDVPIDPTNAQGIVTEKTKLLGRILAVPALEGQLVTTNMLASSASGGQFSVLQAGEAVASNSPYWRAVSLNVPDDRAVGGLLQPNETVDIFVTATVNVPQALLDQGKYYTDKSTKITYQSVPILAKAGNMYIVRVSLAVAEEITHLQASGTAQFSMALRPDEDTRSVDATGLGETTNVIIQRYGLPVPLTFPPGKGGSTSPIPTPFPSPAPAASAPSGSASPAPSKTP
jgi:Flp pilus assembly protein CpaB